MIKNKKVAVVFIAFLLIYTLPELFFENAMLYLSGGVIGGIISEILKGSSRKSSNILVFAIWAILLVGLLLLFIRLRYKPIKYLILLIITFFLYIIDNQLGVVTILEMQNEQGALIVKYVIMILSILFKSTALTWLYFSGKK